MPRDSSTTAGFCRCPATQSRPPIDCLMLPAYPHLCQVRPLLCAAPASLRHQVLQTTREHTGNEQIQSIAWNPNHWWNRLSRGLDLSTRFTFKLQCHETRCLRKLAAPVSIQVLQVPPWPEQSSTLTPMMLAALATPKILPAAMDPSADP